MERLIVLGGLFLFACGSGNDTENSSEGGVLAVACAANMQYAMDSIAVLFEQQEGIKCELTSGSSGMLAAQIENGAPYDMFISADVSYPQAIFDKGNGAKPFVYAKGRVVFVYPKDTTYLTIEQALADPRLKRIGIPESRLAPYGMAAEQFLNHLGLFEQLKEELIKGESIGQINQYLTTGSVNAGFTSYSFRVENEDAFHFLEVDPATFQPIEQAAMILDHGKNENAAASEKLQEFLKSEQCKAVLLYFGYLVD